MTALKIQIAVGHQPSSGFTFALQPETKRVLPSRKVRSPRIHLACDDDKTRGMTFAQLGDIRLRSIAVLLSGLSEVEIDRHSLEFVDCVTEEILLQWHPNNRSG